MGMLRGVLATLVILVCCKLLGRGDKAESFVKEGTNEGFTEIELFNPDGENWVVKRKVFTDKNTDEWFVNGKAHHMSTRFRTCD